MSSAHPAENVNDMGTRYTVCERPKFDLVLKRGQDILKNWLEDQAFHSSERQGDDGHHHNGAPGDLNEGVDYVRKWPARLEHEFELGPLLQ